MVDRAYVLLSGGMDSTTCLFLAISQYGAENVKAFSVDYGQLHRREMNFAGMVCYEQGVDHRIIALAPQPPSPLTDQKKNDAIPDKDYSELSGVSPSYHYFRNGQLLSLLAAWAESDLGDSDKGIIYAGQHAEDAANWAYPDCTPEFLGAMANAIFIGTYQRIRFAAPLEWMTKADVVRLGDRLGVPWAKTYSCYHGGEEHCGVCPTCRARRQAFIDAGVADPTVYMESEPKAAE